MNRRARAHQKGINAERYCAAWLTLKGYRILGCRVRTVAGEVDIVARRGKTLVLVEVKARADTSKAIESVTPQKRQRLAGAANALLAMPEMTCRRGDAAPNIRFDIMTVAPWRLPHH